jgi:hypothetical protein
MEIQCLTRLLYINNTCQRLIYQIQRKRHLNSKHLKQYSIHMSGLSTSLDIDKHRYYRHMSKMKIEHFSHLQWRRIFRALTHLFNHI